MTFDNIVDAQRVLAVLGKRLARFGLTLHPDKTRLVDFRPHMTEGARHTDTDGTNFDFLGFTHVWGRSRNGKIMVRQVTAKGRFARAVAAVNDWCRRQRAPPRPAPPPVIDDAGPLRLLRHWWQHSTIAMVRPSSGADMEEMVVPARSPGRRPMDAPKRNPETPSSATSSDRPRIRRRERISLVKNRMREFPHVRVCEGWGRQRPHLLGDAPILKTLETFPTLAQRQWRHVFDAEIYGAINAGARKLLETAHIYAAKAA